MYAKGMTTRQISETIEDICGFEVSEGMVSDITDKLLPEIEQSEAYFFAFFLCQEGQCLKDISVIKSDV